MLSGGWAVDTPAYSFPVSVGSPGPNEDQLYDIVASYPSGPSSWTVVFTNEATGADAGDVLERFNPVRACFDIGRWSGSNCVCRLRIEPLDIAGNSRKGVRSRCAGECAVGPDQWNRLRLLFKESSAGGQRIP